MKQYILLLITIFYSLTVLAGEYTDSTNIKTDDSLHFTRNFSRKIDKVSSSRFYQMTYIGVPLTVGGIIVKSEDDHFRNLRNGYMPRFDHHADDYLHTLR